MNAAAEARGVQPGSLTVIVPVYNEAPRVEAAVADIVESLEQLRLPYRTRILNDGSTDWSEELERRLRSRGQVEIRSSYPNRGKGAVLRDALRDLDTEFAVVIDGDGEYPAEDIARIVGPLQSGEADWVLGSRYGFGRDRPPQYLATYLVNRIIGHWFYALSRMRLRDPLTGLYGFRCALTADLELHEKRFSYTPELIWKLLRKPGVRWLEVPVGYRFRGYAEGKKIRWWETLTILLAFWRYRKP